ncbi:MULTISPECIES: class III lanthipeptide [Cellulomonas]|nr:MULTISPECIES: class III lanthipeptide [Cellulomonas]
MYVLDLQRLSADEGTTRAPSSNSWFFCFSTGSIFGC